MFEQLKNWLIDYFVLWVNALLKGSAYIRVSNIAFKTTLRLFSRTVLNQDDIQ